LAQSKSSLVVAAVASAAVVAGERVFTAGFMAGVADVAVAIARLIAAEVVELLIAACGVRSVIAVTRIETVIDVAVEVRGAVEPGTGSDEDAVVEPVGPVIAVRRAFIRRIVKIPVRAGWGYSDADADRDLGRRGRRATKQGNCECWK
jgi:hypothetical protein